MIGKICERVYVSGVGICDRVITKGCVRRCL